MEDKHRALLYEPHDALRGLLVEVLQDMSFRVQTVTTFEDVLPLAKTLLPSAIVASAWPLATTLTPDQVEQATELATLAPTILTGGGHWMEAHVSRRTWRGLLAIRSV